MGQARREGARVKDAERVVQADEGGVWLLGVDDSEGVRGYVEKCGADIVQSVLRRRDGLAAWRC